MNTGRVTLALLIALLTIVTIVDAINTRYIPSFIGKKGVVSLQMPPLEAQALFVYDIAAEKVLYAKNENIPLPLASITKIMTALVALESASPDKLISISSEAISREGDTGLMVGEKISLKNLIKTSLTISSNDATAAIALSVEPGETSFIEKMNQKALELGFLTLSFKNETGLDESYGEAGAYGGAKDTAFLLKSIWEKYPEIVSSTASPSQDIFEGKKIIHLENTNKIAGHIPGLLASKTGFTEIAGGNLVFMFDAGLGRPIVVSILGSSQEGRFEDADKIINAILEYFSKNAALFPAIY